jgi:transcriptional regulator with XRE-family HTH domain
VAKRGKAQQQTISRFGNNLRRLRTEKGLTQEQLANDADIPINQVGRIERGEINTTIGTAALIASVLKIKLDDLFE